MAPLTRDESTRYISDLRAQTAAVDHAIRVLLGTVKDVQIEPWDSQYKDLLSRLRSRLESAYAKRTLELLEVISADQLGLQTSVGLINTYLQSTEALSQSLQLALNHTAFKKAGGVLDEARLIVTARDNLDQTLRLILTESIDTTKPTVDQAEPKTNSSASGPVSVDSLPMMVLDLIEYFLPLLKGMLQRTDARVAQPVVQGLAAANMAGRLPDTLDIARTFAGLGLDGAANLVPILRDALEQLDVEIRPRLRALYYTVSTNYDSSQTDRAYEEQSGVPEAFESADSVLPVGAPRLESYTASMAAERMRLTDGAKQKRDGQSREYYGQEVKAARRTLQDNEPQVAQGRDDANQVAPEIVGADAMVAAVFTSESELSNFPPDDPPLDSPPRIDSPLQVDRLREWRNVSPTALPPLEGGILERRAVEIEPGDKTFRDANNRSRRFATSRTEAMQAGRNANQIGNRESPLRSLRNESSRKSTSSRFNQVESASPAIAEQADDKWSAESMLHLLQPYLLEEDRSEVANLLFGRPPSVGVEFRKLLGAWDTATLRFIRSISGQDSRHAAKALLAVRQGLAVKWKESSRAGTKEANRADIPLMEG